MNKSTVLYISPVKSSFILTDLKILKEKYEVVFKTGKWNSTLRVPLLLINQFLYLIYFLPKVNCVIVSFGGYWSFLPTLLSKIFHKRSFIVLHGSDCASIPSLNYGNLRKPLLRLFSYWSYKLAYMLLPVSQSLIKTNNTFCENIMPEKEQGILNFFPNLNTPFKVIPNGFDTDFWGTDKNISREDNRFITVFSKDQFYLKGGDLIIELAKKSPKSVFIIVGCKQPKDVVTPSNVKFKGKLSPASLREEYCKSKYYFQLSCYEGFGCSLCEAMLCGCIPIGSSVNAIPEIISNDELILNERESKLLKTKIDELNSKEISINDIRESIVERYSMNLRKRVLFNVINSKSEFKI